MLTISNAP